MGNPISKLQSDKKLNTSLTKAENESGDQFKLDPRSPSSDISRTPVQLRSPKKHQKITKRQNLNESLSTPTKVQTKGMLNSLLRGRLGGNFDLRSPSANINRTPILLDKTIDSKSEIVLEESFTGLSMEEKLQKDSILEYSEVKGEDSKDSEKLDEVGQDAGEYITKTEGTRNVNKSCEKRKSQLGVLETNLDCLETNLDLVKTGPKLKKSSYCATFEKNKDFTDPRSPSSDFCRTPVLLLDSEMNNISTPLAVNKLTIVNELGDPRSVTREILRTPLRLPTDAENSFTISPTIIPEDLNKSTIDENILNISVESASPTKLSAKTSKLYEIRQDFAKKYGKNIKSDPVNQIYEDVEFHKVTPRKALSATGGRTPLSCVRNKPVHPRSKSDNPQDKKLESRSDVNVRTPLSCVRNINKQPRPGSNNTQDSRKIKTRLVNDLSNEVLTKSVKQVRNVSKIPTLQHKTVNNIVTDNTSQENTPLRSLKPDNWDKDSSIVI